MPRSGLRLCKLRDRHSIRHGPLRRPCHLRKVDQGIAHPTRSGVDEHALPFLRSHRMVEHVVSYLVIGERRCGIKLNAIGQEIGGLCRRNDEFRVVAAAMRSLARAGLCVG
jgi:hypothetical protein